LLGSLLVAACGESTRSAASVTAGGVGGAGGAGGFAGTLFLGGGPPSSGAGGMGPPAFDYSCLSMIPSLAPATRLSVADIDTTLNAMFGEGPSLESRLGVHEQPYVRPVSAAFIRALHGVATERAASAVRDGDVFKICNGVPTTDVNCTENWLAEWGKKLYRRPLSDEQLTAYLAQWRSVARDASDAAAARNALVSMILSPYFVFRIELGIGNFSTALTPGELAARISHFATRMAPDDELRDAAENGRLNTTLSVMSQYDRLSATPPGRAARELLVMEWLGLDQPLDRPDLSPELAADMTRQLRAVVADVFDRQGGKLPALLSSSRTFVNRRLAEHYGFAPQTGDDLVGVDLAPALAAGVLGTGAFLARYPRPTARGVEVETALLNQLIPAHPINASGELGPGSNPRERLQSALSANAACSSCHQLFDPVGLALEAFDDQGRPTDRDSSGAISASGMQISLANPAGLANALIQDGQVRLTAVRRYLELALDRRLTDSTVGGVGVKGIQDPPPVPILHDDPDLDWLRCVDERAQVAGPALDLVRVGEIIVTSQAFAQRAVPPQPIVAFDVSSDPLEHARQEAAAFTNGGWSIDEVNLFQSYASLLREVQDLPSPANGMGGEGAGGAGGEGPAGAPGAAF
jgi:hypothetical protein